MKSAQRGKEIPVNSRKEIDYSTLFSILDALMSEGLTQMELYQKIGTAVCSRPEKGAAAEYLQKEFPDTAGFSPAMYAGCGILSFWSSAGQKKNADGISRL